MSNNRVVLITGISSGIGRAMAVQLVQNGFTVFGTCRDADQMTDLEGIEVLSLDVTDEASVDACVEHVVQAAGHIDILVNNAGQLLLGAIEDTCMEEAKAQFETNFFGVVRMTQAVLLHMRRQQHGHIVNISSVAGLVGVPFIGFYSAGKFALEGFSEALWHEVKPLGINVSLVEPGFINTLIGNHAVVVPASIKDYSPARENFAHAYHEHLQSSPGPESVADDVVRIVNTRTPKLRYRSGWKAGLIFYLSRLIPERLLVMAMRKEFQLNR